jgi:hypothetical protein
MTPLEQLTNWVSTKYEGQLIKRTKEPYFNHLVAVAEMTKPPIVLGDEIALCHDLLEDTVTTVDALLETLVYFGYSGTAANYITNCVIELTDVYSVEAYPHLSKAELRKKKPPG